MPKPQINNPKLSFVMPCFNDGATLKAAVDSILTQDYSEVEVIVVNDGSTDNTAKVLKKLAEKYPKEKFQYLEQTNQGACVARNNGAKLATGKYISFLPADAVLYPGVARSWVNRLEENPDKDFLYGGYLFTDDKGNPAQTYWSEDFDEFTLTMGNYIDGSFPLKKELFDKMGGWDPSIKSLQDWDFWLNAVLKHNAKGMYIQEVYFQTTLPHPGGLSYDSHQHWIARTEQIKNKYGVKTSDMCVASPGAAFHGKNMAKLLDADFKQNPGFKPHKYKLLYLLGFYPSISDQCASVFQGSNAIRIVHWIGSDVFQLLQAPTNTKNQIRQWLANNVDVHFAECEHIQKELASEGIKAEIVPLPPREWFKPNPLPKDFTVAVYLPQVNDKFYLPDFVYEVAKSCPEFKFKFYGGVFHQTVNLPNVQWCGKVKDMQKFIDDCSCLMRILPHDGLPQSLLEFKSAGRQVVTNFRFPFCIIPESGVSVESVKLCLQAAKDRADKEGLDKDGIKFWQEYADMDKFKKKLWSYLDFNGKAYWENRAQIWDEVEMTKVDEITPKIIEKVKELQPKSILDFGCGNGMLYEDLSKIGKYKGIDISEELIKRAKKRFEKGEFEAVPIEKETGFYDVLVSKTTLMAIPNIDEVVAQIKKKAKWGVFYEPIALGERGGNRMLHNRIIENQIVTGKPFFHPDVCTIHDYDKHFHIVKREQIGNSLLFVADLTK